MTSVDADQALLAHSNEVNAPEFDIIDRQISTIYDSNSANYSSGQVKWDLTSLASSSAFMALSEAVMYIPINLTLTAATQAFNAGVENAFALCLKSSDFSIVHSMSVMVNNTEVVGNQPLSQGMIHYKLLSSLSLAELEAMGPNIGLYKQSPDSLQWSAALGEMTNRVGTVDPTPAAPATRNEGRFKRLKDQAWALGGAVLAEYQTDTLLSAAGKSHVDTTVTDVISIPVICCLPLKYLHEFFRQVPLVRGSIIQITLNTHCPATYKVSSSNASVYSAVVSTAPHGFNPLSLTQASVDPGTGLRVTNTAGTLTARAAIGNVLQAGCSINVPMVTLSPAAEQKYISDPVRRVFYTDFITNTSLTVVASGNSSNQFQVTPGTACLRRLIIMPFTYADDNGSEKVHPLLSALTAAGAGTVSPYAFMTNLNVQISGRNIWQSSKSYTWSTFTEEIWAENSINGGLSHGLINTSISRSDWETIYGVVSINLQRHSEAEDAVQKSVTVSFTNSSRKRMSYVMYLEFQRSIQIDVDKGTLVA